MLINKDFGKHSISGLIAYEFNDYYYKNLDVYGTGFVPGFEVLDVVSKPERTKGGISEWATQSYFTQWKYVYDGKYIAEASIRRDGASNLGTNAKYGNLLSGSVGWIISREDWFDVDWIEVEGFRDLIKRSWEEACVEGYASFMVAKKLKVIKAEIKKWNRDVFGNIKIQKYNLMNPICFLLIL